MSNTTTRHLLAFVLCIIALAALLHVLAAMTLFWSWMAAATVVALCAMAFDKWQAQRKKRRVTETALLGTAALGGSAGVAAGIVLTRHKRRSKGFLLWLGLIVLAQAALGVLAWRQGWRPPW